MRILLVSDIHANFEALSAVRGEYDALLCMGDLVDYGPSPKECIAGYCQLEEDSPILRAKAAGTETKNQLLRD